jgi:Tfp pilus assembly protein PilX
MENTELPKPEEQDSSQNNSDSEVLQNNPQTLPENNHQQSTSENLKSLAQNQEPVSVESSESAVQSETTPEKPDHSKFILFIILAVILGVVVAAAASYLVLSNRKSGSQNSEPVTEEATESKEIPREEKISNSLTNESTSSNSNVQSIKLENISFSIPNGWWSKENTDGARKWVLLNPEPLPTPSDALYAYIINAYPNTTLLREISSRKENLDNVVQENRNINNFTVIYLSGTLIDGFLAGYELEYAFVQNGSTVYSLESTGSLENSKEYFKEILNTISVNN